MLYQAYQAHTDIMVPVRLAEMAARSVGRGLTARRVRTVLQGNLTAYELIARSGLT